MADALSESERDSLISQFSGITGSGSDQSRAYLEASGWVVDLAIQSFFEEAEEVGEQEADPQLRAADPPPLFAPSLLVPAADPTRKAMSDSKKKPVPRTGIATLSSLRRGKRIRRQ